MSRFIDQHIVFQRRKFTSWGRGILIVVFPVLFIRYFLIAPGLWAHQTFPMPVGLGEIARWPLGVLICGAGLGLYLWTIVLFAMAQGTQVPVAPTQRVVSSGPYSVCRNPMLSSAFMMVCGAGVLLDSWSFMLGGLLIPSAYSLYIKRVEERELEARFGDEYLSYKQSTPFLIPRIRT